MDRKKLFHTLAILIVLIFLINATANKFYWYSSIWYFDILMHFLGGFWVGILALYLLRTKTLSLRLLLRALSIVLVVGLGWEIFEAIVNETFSKDSFNVLDTASDIFFDMAGGMAAGGYYMKKIMNRGADKVK